MEASVCYEKERNSSNFRTPLLLVAGMTALCVGLAALLVAESGLVPVIRREVSEEMRLVVGAHGAILFLVGTVLVTRTGSRAGQRKPSAPGFYKFHGQNNFRPGDAFQTFEIGLENKNPILSTWADPVAGSRICTRIDKNGRFLRVEFLNERCARPCNVLVGGLGQSALLNVPERRHLQFQARVPGCEPKYTRPGSQHIREKQEEHDGAPQRVQNVRLNVRLVNGPQQHWVWQGSGKEAQPLVVQGHSWKQFSLPLGRGWDRFWEEGNLDGPKKPDFSIIAGILFELGAESDLPGEGYGVIDIRDIRCAD